MRGAYIYCTLLIGVCHIAWGITLMAWPSAAGATALYSLLSVLPGGNVAEGFMLMLIGSMGCGAALMRPSKLTAVLISMQQISVLLSAVDALYAVHRGSYADGTMIPRPHIFNDQFGWAVFAVSHTMLVVVYHIRAPRDG